MIKELKLIHRLPSPSLSGDEDDRRPVEAILSAYTKAATKRKRKASSAVPTTPSSGDCDYLAPPAHKRSNSSDYLRDEREESHHHCPTSSLSDDDECIGLVTSYRRRLHRQGTVRHSNRRPGDDERRESPTTFHELDDSDASHFPSLQRATKICDDSSDSLYSLASEFTCDDPPEMTFGSRPSSSMGEPLDAELAGGGRSWERDCDGPQEPAGDAAEERELPEWLAGGSFAPAPFAFRPPVPAGAFRPFHHGRA